MALTTAATTKQTFSLSELETKDKLISSIHKISSLLTRPISLDKILTMIVEETSEVFGFTRVALFLHNKQLSLLECRFIHGFNPQDTERALRYPYRPDIQDCVETKVLQQGKTIFIKEFMHDPRVTPTDLKVSRIMRRVSTIAVPLKIKRDVIGLITADKGDTKLQLTTKDIKALTTFANQASLIIENARLQEQNQQKIKQLLTLQESSKKASSTFDPKRLFTVISTSAMRIARAGQSCLYLWDDEHNRLQLVASRNKSQEHTFILPPAHNGLIGLVVRQAAPILVTNTEKEPRFKQYDAQVRCQLAVPLINEKRLLGVLAVQDQTVAAFGEEDQKLLMIFAGHCASLLNNARLYGQVTMERNYRENILESSPNSIISVDLKKQITSINQKTEEMFGFQRAQIIGKQAEDIFSEQINEVIDLALGQKNVVDNHEIEGICHGSTTPPTWGLTSSLLKNQHKRLLGVTIIIRDLTEEKKTVELIRRLDRLTSLGQMSAGLAHEIRNPLTSINFNVQLLAKQLSKAGTPSPLTDDIQEGVDRIRILVKGMLDFAKPSPPQLQPGSLLPVLEHTVNLMDSQLKKHQVQIHFSGQESLPSVHFDAHHMQQVFVNLLQNAMEAMPMGGTIDLCLTHEKGRGRQPDLLVLSCTDHGIGIEREDLAKIFNPFFTTKAEGTGLGLSIVHKILEQHNVEVDVQSNHGQGTSFFLRFPALRQ